MISVRFEGMEAALRAVSTERLLGVVKAGMPGAAGHVQKIVATYPQEPGGRAQFPDGFKSMKQQRFFFMALKKGIIDVPYKRGGGRSKKLGGSWNIQAQDDGLTQEVGTAVSYAQIVKKEEEQSSYHAQTGWHTVEQDAKEAEPIAAQFMSDWLRSNV